MESINIEQMNKQKIAYDLFFSRAKIYTTALYSSTITGGIIALLTGLGVLEINSINVFLYYVFLLISPVILGIGILAYLLPIVPFKPKRNDIFLGIDYVWILQEQAKPTTTKYKIRKVILLLSFISGVLVIIFNIIFFLVELFIIRL